MFDYQSHLAARVQELKEAGNYRVFVEIERLAGSFPQAVHHHDGNQRLITVWCSNDHLGMGQNPDVMAAMKASIDRSGVAAGGSRNISGNNHNHILLEKEIAELHRKERGLTFITGYAANEAALGVLGRRLPGCVFFSDEFNHASMIIGMQQSGAEKHVFGHNDVDHLDFLLRSVDRDRPKVVAFESIYSMDGDRAPMVELCSVAKKHNALVYVDEAHTVAMYGPEGAGLAAQLGVADQVDILMGTFAKGYGTAGGYIVGADAVLDAIRSFAPAFIFTLAMPPSLAAAALTSVRHLRHCNEERRQLHARAAQLKARFHQAGIPMVCDQSHIVPVLVGDPHHCKQLADTLLIEHAMYVQPINFPSVARGTERLRINPSPVHRPDEVDRFADAVDLVWTQLGLPRTRHSTVVERTLLEAR
ncbi:5-aminolevulinate synthase [Amycolatopsis rifamycinica]|uniref:5-aminolevulinic acid synthase n=1 Tax=Amycolatopsis rifamycinica TaxID=287986 RepID=A0A066TMS9_9PSEU|nr:5-aminolevulinate synthase [Amycolatopsis rifamycinica]KDN16441.1 5-aminolevulinate synthase [Amycolatopsis rifamycinica]